MKVSDTTLRNAPNYPNIRIDTQSDKQDVERVIGNTVHRHTVTVGYYITLATSVASVCPESGVSFVFIHSQLFHVTKDINTKYLLHYLSKEISSFLKEIGDLRGKLEYNPRLLCPHTGIRLHTLCKPLKRINYEL